MVDRACPGAKFNNLPRQTVIVVWLLRWHVVYGTLTAGIDQRTSRRS